MIIDPCNGVYSDVNHPGEDHSIDGDIMYLPGNHMNYISDAKTDGCYNVLELKFKCRCSRIYTYGYDEPGRTGDDAWDGTDPEYYE